MVETSATFRTFTGPVAELQSYAIPRYSDDIRLCRHASQDTRDVSPLTQFLSRLKSGVSSRRFYESTAHLLPLPLVYAGES